MAAKKFLRLVAGAWTEIIATVVSAGAANDGDIPALDATGKLDVSVMPVGIGADTNTVVAFEALAANDLVNVFDNAGTPGVRKADATNPAKQAVGFVLSAVAAAGNAVIYSEGTNVGTGFTGGQLYLSATTPGKATNTVPTGVGKIVQKVGIAMSATSMNFQQGEPVTLAS